MGRGTTQAERSMPLQPGTPEYAAEVERQRLQQAKNNEALLAQINLSAAQNDPRANGAFDDAYLQSPSGPRGAEVSGGGNTRGYADQVTPTAAGAGSSNRPGYQTLGGESGGMFGIPGLPDWGDVIPGIISGGIQYGLGKATETSPKDVGKDYGEAYGESYEEIMKAHRGEAEAMLQKDLDMQRQFTPQQQRLAYEGLVGSEEAKLLPEGYVPGIREHAQLGADVDNITRRGAAGTDLDIMRQQGPYMAQSTMDQLAITDQPWMQTRDAGAQKVQELLGSINMGGLSGGERAEVERMNARRNMQRGSAGGGGNLTAIENAMQFGSALDRKRAALGNALQTATGFMAGSRSGFDPVQATLGRGSGTNQIASGFQGVQPVKDYSNQMSGLPNNIMTGTNQGGLLGTMKQGKSVIDQWLGN